MRLLIQRVISAKVIIKGKPVAEIDRGLLVFVGIGKDDGIDDAERMAKKIVNLRIFEDENSRMNLNISQINGKILSVPQFTLYADTSRGNRPGFESSAKPDVAKDYWEKFNYLLESTGIEVKRGVFGEHMQVELVNDGPVTIWLDSKS